jgi:hypothetical protein
MLSSTKNGSSQNKQTKKLDIMALACNPSYLGNMNSRSLVQAHLGIKARPC